MRWFQFSHPWIWMIAFLSLLSRTWVSGDATVTCGTQFVDPASSALLADVVLEGRVREKMTSQLDSTSTRYNITIQVRKQILKGEKHMNEGKKSQKLLIGEFDLPGLSRITSNEATHGVTVSHDAKRHGNVVTHDWRRNSDCVGNVDRGATYIFFLRYVGDGKYFQISALPVKKTRQAMRSVSSSLKENGAKSPSIQNLKGPTKHVSENSSVTFRCKAKAKPVPIYTWYRNGQKLTPAKGQSIKNTKHGSRLQINNVKANHSGVYTCVAQNAVGEASKNASLTVEHGKLYVLCSIQTLCLNGGTCFYVTDLQQPFCACPEIFEGIRCEKEVAHPSILKGEATLSYQRTLIIIGIVIALLVFVVICIASYFLVKRRRKRWETKTQMRNLEKEYTRLLGKKALDQHSPDSSGRPMAQKETQTDTEPYPPERYPPALPPKRENESEPSFATHRNSNNIFLRDHSFPVITAAIASSTTAMPAFAHSQMPSHHSAEWEPKGVERKGSRTRLKAVSVDDSCQDRPASVVATVSEVPRSFIIHVGSPQVSMEMGRADSQAEVSDPQHKIESPVRNVHPPALVSQELRVPVQLEKQPTASAHAQLKSLKELDSPSCEKALTDQLPLLPKNSLLDAKLPSRGFPGLNPSNGLSGLDSDTDEDENTKLLPILHISEDDLNGNPPKHYRQKSQDFRPKKPVVPMFSTDIRNGTQSSNLPSPPKAPRGYAEGVHPISALTASPNSLSEEDSQTAELSGRHFSSSEDASPVGNCYAFEPHIDSDPNEFDDQFMHGSPNKPLYKQRDLEHRLRNVPDNQEPIPI